MSKVVIIGAGVGGLATAARLSAAGHDVTVLEQAERIGGKLSLHEASGFRWDTGPSLLTMPHVLEETFAAAGAQLADHLTLERLNPIATYRFADGTRLHSDANVESFFIRLDEELSRGSGEDWRRLLRAAQAMWDVVEQPFLRSPLGGARGIARQARRWRDLPKISPLLTLRELGRRHIRDPRLRMFLERYATYTGSDPRRAPATLAVIPYVEQHFGGWYVAGGLYGIVEALATVAQSHGTAIRTAAPVGKVQLRGRTVSGVELDDGEVVPADIVVANADAAQVYRELLPPDVAQRPLQRLQRAERSLSGFVLLLGVRDNGDEMPHHTVLFPSDYDAEFDAIFGPRPRPAADPTLYIAAPPDTSVAPPGHRSWFVLANAPRHGYVDWRNTATAGGYTDHLLERLSDRGLDLSGRIVQQQVLTPHDLQLRTRAPGGAIYGTSSNGVRSAFLRPSNTTPVNGLYLVGGSSHPGGGLPLVLLSASIVSSLVERRQRHSRS